MNRLVVVKVGGSLLDWEKLPERLPAFLEAVGAPVVLVVGGGGAADVIRRLDSVHDLGEQRAHGLALRTLGLTAELLGVLVPGLEVVERAEDAAAASARGRTPVLDPGRFMHEVDRVSDDPLPETWGTTSDSIAARVARHLGAAGLVLLKSTGPGCDVERAAAVRMGLVDPSFPRAATGLGWVRVVNFRANPVRTCTLI